MNAVDMPVFHERLNEVFAALNNGKLPNALALATWTQVLREFPLPDIVDVLTGWAKEANKAPVPAEVYKACAIRRGNRVEQNASADKSRFASEEREAHRHNPAFAAKLHDLTLHLTSPGPKRDPKQWASDLYDRFLSDRNGLNGQPISYVQIEFACKALHINVRDAYESRARERAGDVA